MFSKPLGLLHISCCRAWTEQGHRVRATSTHGGQGHPVLSCSIQAAKHSLGLFHSSILRLCPAGPWFQLSCIFPATHFPTQLSLPSLCSGTQAPLCCGGYGSTGHCGGMWQSMPSASLLARDLAANGWELKRSGDDFLLGARSRAGKGVPACLDRCQDAAQGPQGDHAGMLLGRTDLPNPAPAA